MITLKISGCFAKCVFVFVLIPSAPIRGLSLVESPSRFQSFKLPLVEFSFNNWKKSYIRERRTVWNECWCEKFNEKLSIHNRNFALLLLHIKKSKNMHMVDPCYSFWMEPLKASSVDTSGWILRYKRENLFSKGCRKSISPTATWFSYGPFCIARNYDSDSIPQLRDPHPRFQGERTWERGRGKRYRSKAKYGNQSKLKSAGPKRQTSPNVL